MILILDLVKNLINLLIQSKSKILIKKKNWMIYRIKKKLNLIVKKIKNYKNKVNKKIFRIKNKVKWKILQINQFRKHMIISLIIKAMDKIVLRNYPTLF